MRIYTEGTSTIFEGKGVYPKGIVFAKRDNGNFIFSATSGNESKFSEININWTNIKDINGDTFGTVELARDYLAGILGSDIAALQTSLTSIDDKLSTFEGVTRTPSLTRETGSGTVAAGARTVNVFNAGGANGVLLGVTIKPGESIPFRADAEDDVLAAISFDGTGTELIISKVI